MTRAGAATRPRTPTGLDKDVRKVWRSVTGLLCSRGMFDSLDVDVIVQYCRAKVEADFLYTEFHKHGRAYHKGGKVLTNPFWEMWLKADGHANRLARQIGLTPAARMRKQPSLPTGERPRPTPVILDVEVVESGEGGGG